MNKIFIEGMRDNSKFYITVEEIEIYYTEVITVD
jgi:hypothetical protein